MSETAVLFKRLKIESKYIYLIEINHAFFKRDGFIYES